MQKSHFIHANGLAHHVVDSMPSTINGTVLLLHGFPDDHTIWAGITPLLTDAGYRVIAPDMRGFGKTEMANSTSDYEFTNGSIPDVLGILDGLNCGKVHLVGHDLGAGVAWMLAGRYPERFHSMSSLSVGHHRSFSRVAKTKDQRQRSNYILFHQLTGFCEWSYQRNDWAQFRRIWDAHNDLEETISKLARPGRLKAGLNWYRANLGLKRMIKFPDVGAFGNETIRIPSLGVWSSGDSYLTEEQVTGSAEFIDADWRYERLEKYSHWFPAEAPERVADLLIAHWSRQHADIHTLNRSTSNARQNLEIDS